MLHVTLGISFLFSQQLERGDTSVFTPILQMEAGPEPLLATSRGKELGSDSWGATQPSFPGRTLSHFIQQPLQDMLSLL